ncbi:MAG: NAD(P)-dependent oxidoreductase [Actinobacteria bacterium]|nr:MAG: NAD(P)-dependent oxidoreductase [Actinomycetota bacterium]REK40226.1 MAG: NAD(P)-dependent oxidoreductase [Actinomycetota bacterium]
MATYDQTESRGHSKPLVVMTGGTGLIGSSLIERLVDRYRLVNLDLEGDPESSPHVEFIPTDLTSDTSVSRAVERIAGQYGSHIASLVHLAAFYDFAGEDSPLYDEVTVEGTRRLLEAITKLRVDQVVFSSTMLVHEPTTPGKPIDEDDAIEATWPYPESKVETEDVVSEETTAETKAVVVRLAGIYDEMGHSPPITNQIKRIDGKWVTSHFYPADLERGQAFVHLDDAVDAITRIVDRRSDLPDDVEILIAEPVTLGYGQLQDLIARELHGTDWTTMEIPEAMAKAGAWFREKNPFGEDPFIRSWMVDRASDHYEIDISRARELLDWKPEHTVDEVVPEMIRRLEADREGWYRENDLTPPATIAA